MSCIHDARSLQPMARTSFSLKVQCLDCGDVAEVSDMLMASTRDPETVIDVVRDAFPKTFTVEE